MLLYATTLKQERKNMSNKKETSCKVASTAGKLLSSKSTSKSVKSVAVSALKKNKKTCTKK